MAEVANAMIPVPWAEDEKPEDVNLQRLQQRVLQPGEKIPAKTFSKEELDRFRASGAICDEKEFVSDEEKATALSLSALEAFQAGKRAAFEEENPDAEEIEIDKAGNVVPPDDHTKTSGSNPPAPKDPE